MLTGCWGDVFIAGANGHTNIFLAFLVKSIFVIFNNVSLQTQLDQPKGRKSILLKTCHYFVQLCAAANKAAWFERMYNLIRFLCSTIISQLLLMQLLMLMHLRLPYSSLKSPRRALPNRTILLAQSPFDPSTFTADALLLFFFFSKRT